MKLLRPARPPVPRRAFELRHASALWRGVVPGSARADRCEQRGGGRVTVMVRSHWWESRGYPELRPGVRTQRQQRRARPRGPSAHPVTPARTRRGDEPTGYIYGNAPAAGTAAGEAANRRVPFFRDVGSRKSEVGREVGSRFKWRPSSSGAHSIGCRMVVCCLCIDFRFPTSAYLKIR